MKKETKKRNKKKKIEPKNSKTYKLEDYRNKKRNDSNPNRRKPQSLDYQQRFPSYEGYPNNYYRNTEAEPSPEIKRQQIRKNNKLSRAEILKRRKRQRNIFIKRLAMVGCLVAILAYGVVQGIDMFLYPSVSYQTVQEGMIDNSEEKEGFIVRSEQVINSPRDGNIHHIIGEGERVTKGGEVAFIASDIEMANALEIIYELDKNIYNIQDKRNDYSYFQAEISQLNAEIKDDMVAFYNTKYWENPTQLYQLRKQLEKVIQDRTTIYINDTSELTEDLQIERTALQNQLMNYQNTVIAESSGIVSYAIDGYENMNFDTIEAMNYTFYKEQIDHAKELTVGTTPYGMTNQPLYKLINSGTWKIVTYMTPEEAGYYEEKGRYAFYLVDGDDKPITFTLDKKTEEGEFVQCVFSTDEKIADFLGVRYTQFVIGENKAEGLKIPIDAIVEKNIIPIPIAYVMTEGREYSVLKQNGQLIEQVPINIQYQDDTYAYIMQEIDNPQTIQLGQTLKMPDQEEVHVLSEIESVEGVYVINGSYAKFKRIEIALANKEYVILTDGPLTTIKEFDQIISNPTNIREDQLLKYMDVQNQ